MNKQQVSVLGCLVRNGQVLMIKSLKGQVHDLPQGLVDFDEPPDDAILRIYQDLTGLVVEPITPFRVHSFTIDQTQNIAIHYLVSLADNEDDEFIIDENDVELNWIDQKRIEEERPSWQDEIRQSVELALELETENYDQDMIG